MYNLGIVTFMIYHYLNWVPGFSEDVLAICRLYGQGHLVCLDDLTDVLADNIFNRHCFGKRSELVFDTILSFPGNRNDITRIG